MTPDKLGNGLVRWIPRKGEKWEEKQLGKKVNRENKNKKGLVTGKEMGNSWNRAMWVKSHKRRK